MPQPGNPAVYPEMPPQPWQEMPDMNAVNEGNPATMNGVSPADAGMGPAEIPPEEASSTNRKRRSARWEEDWSE